jgi:hypothetical protein
MTHRAVENVKRSEQRWSVDFREDLSRVFH